MRIAPLPALAFLVGAALACSEDTKPPPDAAVDAAPAVDGSAIGAACKTSADCSGGAHPTCWAHNAFNSGMYVAMPGGYCSSKCESDADCGPNGRCYDFVNVGAKWCLANCNGDGDCRTNGVNDAGMGAADSPYACWLAGYCWVTSPLDCDPTAGDGTCSTAGAHGNLPGGCMREADGLGKRGSCTPLCTVGTATCPTRSDGVPQSCQVTDARYDPSGNPTGDKFVGPVCTFLPTTCFADGDCATGETCMGATGSTPGTCTPSPLHPTGQECTYAQGGQTGHFSNVCVDGDECYLKSNAPMGFTSSGDNDCHVLCFLPGGGPGPTGSDMGAPMGTPAASCPTGTKCTDVWGLANAATPQSRVGFCL